MAQFIEIGRVCQVNYGPDQGKLCTVLDVIDGQSVLVDGPAKKTGVARQVIGLKRLNLTNFKVEIGRGARVKSLTQAFDKADVLAKWEQTGAAKKLKAQTLRKNLSDFDRFKVMLLRKKKSQLVRKEVAKLKKSKK